MFFFKQKTAYEMRISDWSSDVCSSDLVAAAARALGVKATIVMPFDAPALKIANTRAYGARIVHYDRLKDDREAIARTLADEAGLAVVPPYDDPDVMAGQGTVGLELMEQAAEAGADVRSEEHTSELQSLMRISYAVFCLKKKKREH